VCFLRCRFCFISLTPVCSHQYLSRTPNLHYCPKTRDQVTQEVLCFLFFKVLVTRLNGCEWNCSYILLSRLEFSLNFKLCNDEGLTHIIQKNKWSCHPNGKLKCVQENITSCRCSWFFYCNKCIP
jgi:hypothetical protein